MIIWTMVSSDLLLLSHPKSIQTVLFLMCSWLAQQTSMSGIMWLACLSYWSHGRLHTARVFRFILDHRILHYREWCRFWWCCNYWGSLMVLQHYNLFWCVCSSIRLFLPSTARTIIFVRVQFYQKEINLFDSWLCLVLEMKRKMNFGELS
jgi:hypothetical protein